MNIIKIWHIITLKNYTYEELKRITKYGAVLSVSGVFATYLVWQYRLKQAEYTQEAFKLVTQNRPLVEMIGSFRTGMISLSKRQTFLDKNTAKMKVFLKGTNANGMLYFEATRDQTDNHWKVYKCEFEFLDAAGGRVRLIKEPEKREISDKSAAADTVKNSES